MKRKRGQRRPSRPLDDLEVLTQFGCASNPQGRFGGICRSEPRNFEDALSLIRGDLSVAEAASRVRPLVEKTTRGTSSGKRGLVSYGDSTS